MIPYQRFVDEVQSKAALSTAEEARDTAVSVVQVVAGHLDGVDCEQLATTLPPAIRDPVNWDVAPAPLDGTDQLIQEVAEHASRPPEQIRYLLEAVLSEIATSDRAVGDELAHRLPPEVSTLIGAPGHGPPPHWEAAGTEGRPRPLDSGELERALHGLTNWSGNIQAIRREVRLPAERWAPVKARVQAAQQELSHHASIEEQGGGAVVFTLRTRLLDTVTELDLQLARRIDEAVAEVGSGGQPGS